MIKFKTEDESPDEHSRRRLNKEIVLSTITAKLLIGAREGVVRGRLESAGYEVRALGFPVEDDGWVGAWEVSQ